MKAVNFIPRKKHTAVCFKCSWGFKAHRSIGPGFGIPGSKEINHKGIMERFNEPHELSRWHNGKESACQCRKRRRCWFNPWVRKIPWNGNALLYSCLENPMDRGAWWAPVQGVTKNQTQLSKPSSAYQCTMLAVWRDAK